MEMFLDLLIEISISEPVRIMSGAVFLASLWVIVYALTPDGEPID